ncbi:hypothetical protein SAY86_004053 [Trapa natans]|uniref:PHD and RING finger domain-containing protein 1 n=1 Tax=Trapa natans TaxID=22666 RepID=A0AAN7MI14_TRANT|nr:hypothetical protein SAY86_004053 [Trapa natans]
MPATGNAERLRRGEREREGERAIPPASSVRSFPSSPTSSQMVRGAKGGSKRDFNKKVDEISDDSDEDYVVSDEQSDASVDALEDLVGSASDDGLGEFLNDEILNEGDDVNDDDYGGEEEREEEEEGEEEDKGEEEEEEIVKSEASGGSSAQRKSRVKTNKKHNKVYLEESDDGDEDYNVNDDEDEDDEEFTPDEDDCLVDEEDSVMEHRSKNKLETYSKLSRNGMRKTIAKSGQKQRKKIATRRNLSGNKKRKIKQTRKKASFEDEDENDADFAEMSAVMQGRGSKTFGRSKRRYKEGSDSDFGSSRSSDFEYTISEEEREQVREANEICKDLIVTPPKRTSSSDKCMKGDYLRLRRGAPSRKTVEDVGLMQQRKSFSLKGKQKVEELIKQVCGICLSEEDKRRIRGTLDCCSHYFCFSCIMEWSKVESRCPLCKQRFKTISKPARSAAGVDLRDVVIHVPERDQVYQPSEEEIRGYLDPYENVICTECHQGGDDGLMLLCDLCDSPAHTYCVGLGREVPEGNWYCEGCRPGALGSSSSDPQDPTLSSQWVGVNLADGLDLNVAPPLSFTQGAGNLTSPRFYGLINQATTLFSGAGATTVSGRRRIQRHIHQILSGHRTTTMALGVDGMSPFPLAPYPPNLRVDQPMQTPIHNSAPEITASLESIFGGRFQETIPASLRSGNDFLSGQNTLRRQIVEEATVTTSSNTSRVTFFNEPGDVILAPEQLHQSSDSRLSLGTELAASPLAIREDRQFYRVKEQVQSMVRNHLKNISNDALGK